MKILNRKKLKGFSLIEILVVIAIIGVLAGIVLTGVGTARQKAREIAAKMECKSIFNAILLLETDTDEWPGHQVPDKVNQVDDNEICADGCAYSFSDNRAGLVGTDANYPNWRGPYIKEIPKDPWGNEYFFDTDYDTGTEWVAVVGSYGPNGAGNNQYDADDIIYILPTY